MHERSIPWPQLTEFKWPLQAQFKTSWNHQSETDQEPEGKHSPCQEVKFSVDTGRRLYSPSLGNYWILALLLPFININGVKEIVINAQTLQSHQDLMHMNFPTQWQWPWMNITGQTVPQQLRELVTVSEGSHLFRRGGDKWLRAGLSISGYSLSCDA